MDPAASYETALATVAAGRAATVAQLRGLATRLERGANTPFVPPSFPDAEAPRHLQDRVGRRGLYSCQRDIFSSHGCPNNRLRYMVYILWGSPGCRHRTCARPRAFYSYNFLNIVTPEPVDVLRANAQRVIARSLRCPSLACRDKRGGGI